MLIDLNSRPFKKLEGSRQSAFETIDRPAMKPLPATRYEFAEWKTAIVNIDYHVDADGHYRLRAGYDPATCGLSRRAGTALPTELSRQTKRPQRDLNP